MTLRSRVKPLIVNCCLTGARYERNHPDLNFRSDHMPLSSSESVEAAIEAYQAGARVLHVHARNSNSGKQFASTKWYKEFFSGARANCPGLILGAPTSRKGEVADQIDARREELKRDADCQLLSMQQIVETELIRANGVYASPDTITTFTASEINLLGSIKENEEEYIPKWSNASAIQAYYRVLTSIVDKLGVGHEIEITTSKAFPVLEFMASDPTFPIRGPVHFVLLFGFSKSLPITKEAFDSALCAIDKIVKTLGCRKFVSVGAVIRPFEAISTLKSDSREEELASGKHDYREIFEWIAKDERVDAIRVGLEDTSFMYSESQSNKSLVENAVSLCREFGIRVVTEPTEVRARFFGIDNPGETDHYATSEMLQVSQ